MFLLATVVAGACVAGTLLGSIVGLTFALWASKTTWYALLRQNQRVQAARANHEVSPSTDERLTIRGQLIQLYICNLAVAAVSVGGSAYLNRSHLVTRLGTAFDTAGLIAALSPLGWTAIHFAKAGLRHLGFGQGDTESSLGAVRSIQGDAKEFLVAEADRYSGFEYESDTLGPRIKACLRRGCIDREEFLGALIKHAKNHRVSTSVHEALPKVPITDLSEEEQLKAATALLWEFLVDEIRAPLSRFDLHREAAHSHVR